MRAPIGVVRSNEYLAHFYQNPFLVLSLLHQQCPESIAKNPLPSNSAVDLGRCVMGHRVLTVIAKPGRWFWRPQGTVHRVFVDSVAIWVVTAVLGIRGGWGRNGEPVSFDALTALGVIVLAAALMCLAASKQTPRKTLGIVSRLSGLWAVGFSWVGVLWLAGQTSTPTFLYAWFAIGIGTGWILIAAFGILVELIHVLVPRRDMGIALLVIIGGVLGRWTLRPVDGFYMSYPWGSVLDAAHSPIMRFGPTVAAGLDHAWPIATSALSVAIIGWIIQMLLARSSPGNTQSPH